MVRKAERVKAKEYPVVGDVIVIPVVVQKEARDTAKVGDVVRARDGKDKSAKGI